MTSKDRWNISCESYETGSREREIERERETKHVDNDEDTAKHYTCNLVLYMADT